MAELGTAFVRVQPDLTALNQQVAANFAGSRWKGLGKAAGVALGAGLVAGGAIKGLYEIGQAFDDAYDKIRVTTGKSGRDLAKLEKSFKSVVSDVPADFEDASTAVADLNQRLGITGGPLQKLSKQMLELSRITHTDVATNVQSVTRLFGDWSIKTGKQAETLNKLFRASQATGIQVADLSDLMVQFGSPLRQLGLDFDTAAAMFSRFEKEGVNIQTLMPGLRMALKNFSSPTADLSAQLDKLGVSLEEGPAAALQDVFAALEKAPSDLKANALAFQVFGARAGPDMAAAVREGRFELDELMKTIVKGDDTIRKAGRETMDFGEQWQRLKNNVFVALEPVATKVFGALGDEMRRVTNILTNKKLSANEKFSAIMDEIQRAAKKWGPQIAEAGGKLGVALVKGIAGAFVHSDLLGKLFIGAAAVRLFGGSGALTALGKTMGGRIGTTAGRYAGPAFALAFITLGLTDKKFRGAAVEGGKRIGELFVNALIDVVNAGLDNIEQILDDANVLAALGVDAPNFGDIGHVAFSNYQKVIDSGVAESAERGIEAIKGLKTEIEDLDKAMDASKPTLRSNAERIDMMGDNLKSLRSQIHTGREVWQGYGKGVSSVAQGVSKAVDHHRDRARDDLRAVGKSLDKTRRDADRYADGTGKSYDSSSDAAKRMAKRTSGSVRSLADAVRGGMENIADNTNEALKGFNVKKLAFSFKKVGGAAEGLAGGYQRGGEPPWVQIPGIGSGDKVPVHVGGQLVAMTEPTERLYVLNRSASAYKSALESLNRNVPRRARGGWVDPAGPGHGVVNPAIAGVVGNWSKRFNAAINYGYDPGGGHLSPGHNITGTATDTGPAAGWGAGPTKLFEQGLRLLVGSGLTVLYGSHGVGTAYPNHGYRNHAHIEWGMHPEIKGLAGAVAETIKRIILKGPKGPLRDTGQAALDKARAAANAYIRSKSGGFMGGDIGAPIRSLPEALQKYNRTYPEAPYPKNLTAYHMPFNAVAAMAEWAGAPGVSFARTAIGESALAPGASGQDPNGVTEGLGLWMITTGFNDALIRKYGGRDSMFNPALNAKAMSSIFDSQGYGAWYSKTLDTSGTHYSGPLLRRRGGPIPNLAKGGDTGKGTVSGGRIDPAFKRLMKIRRIADKLKSLLGEKGRIAKLDERIANAETLAGLDFSERGSDLGPAELAKQIALNERLLSDLTRARKLARTGLHLSELHGISTDQKTKKRFKQAGRAFGEQLTELSGLTGRGGRIFDAQVQLKTLRHTGAAAPTALDIAGLRSVIEAARYGVFDGAFATGGQIAPGRWGVVGEHGPEVVRGPATVHSAAESQSMLAPKIEVHNDFDFDGLDLIVTTTVNGEIAKRERIGRRRARQTV